MILTVVAKVLSVHGFRERLPAYVTLFFNAAFGGATTVAIPTSLAAGGLTKAQIAVFFVVNSIIAVSYNVILMPRVRRCGYPQWALAASTAAVAIGVIVIRLSLGALPWVFLGGALMMFVSMTVPQVMGRVALNSTSDAAEGIVANLRMVLVAGYIIGVGIYGVVAAVGADALLVAGCVAAIAFLGALGTEFRGAHAATPEPAELGRVNTSAVRWSWTFIAALALVATMKGVDTLRGIYLPLCAVSSGIDPAAVAPMFMLASVLELIALPILARMSSSIGSGFALAIVAGSGVLVFALMLGTSSYGGLLLSQAVYAVFGAGFQSIGLVLLAQASGTDIGSGASSYMAVTQIGTVMGAVLPLVVVGYSASIFLIALILCVLAVVLALIVGIARKRGTIVASTHG
uniref:hypothetical protein n=1 Tax=Brachybacterium alimentarium TaxID=47845 RepID=UPI0011C031DB|nr:hypothetical protein [Brachybacterium alimentarium]